MAQIEDLVARKEAVESQLLTLRGVTGVDVGFKEVNGRQTDQLSIRVHVAKKLERVAAADRVPAEIDGVATDVLERNYELQVASEALDVSLMADTTHYPSLQGGISIGPSRAVGGFVFAGTLGAVVIDNASNQHAALTNFHVACVDNGWHVGDRQVQPSRIDTGVPPGDEFGAILRATLSTHVDGALISIDSSRTSVCSIAEIGTVRGTKVATLGAAVRKRGRTTGLTYGSVDGIAATINVDYGDGIGARTLSNQVSIKADTTKNALFSDHGDSGSVIVDDQGYVIGLLFAGAGAGTVANPIASVLSELNISMCVGKALLKDLKDGRKDIIKDKELAKEHTKEFKEIRKDIVKDKELAKELKETRKDVIKDKELKENVENKPFKDIADGPRKRIGDNFPPGPGPDPGPELPGAGPIGQFAERLDALEASLSQLVSFILPEQRPDLRAGAFSGEADLGEAELAELRALLQQQAADAAAAKADLDTRWT